jgi:hypothetical protein
MVMPSVGADIYPPAVAVCIAQRTEAESFAMLVENEISIRSSEYDEVGGSGRSDWEYVIYAV